MDPFERLAEPIDPFAELERLREAFSRRPLAEGELEVAIEEAKVERARMAGEKNERVLRQGRTGGGEGLISH